MVTPVSFVELRQYALVPGRRDTLVTLFDRHFVESQEADGMVIHGQFRDLDDPDRFVWVRSFPSMAARKASLEAFYGGPVWKTHRDAANATMVDVSDVLLMRSLRHFPVRGPRPPVDTASVPSSAFVAGLCTVDPSAAFPERFVHDLEPRLGAPVVGTFRTIDVPNTFPALPVRTGEDVFVWFARLDAASDLDGFVDHVRSLPFKGATLHLLRLAPTARSALR